MTAPPRFDRPSRPLRTCSAVGCGLAVPSHLLMCMDHWRLVPAKLARGVLLAWRNRDRGNAQTLAYQAAVAAAVRAVAEKELARGTLRVPGLPGGGDLTPDLFDPPAPIGHAQLSEQEQKFHHVSTSATATPSPFPSTTPGVQRAGPRRRVAAGGGQGDQCAGGLRGAG